MAIFSYPFNNQDTSETQYSDLFRELAETGVAASADSNALQVGASGADLTVTIQPGFAIVRGFAFNNTAIYNLTIDPVSVGRTDRIVLRLDPAADSIIPAVLKGTPGAGAPSLTQTAGGVWEMPLGSVALSANAPAVTSGMVSDERMFKGHSFGTWTTANRPATPRKGKPGFNLTAGRWEFWDGSKWSDVSPSVSWDAITNKPTAFPTTWDVVSDKPASFTPATHTHSYAPLPSLGYGYVQNTIPNQLIAFRYDGRVLIRVDSNEIEVSQWGHPHNADSIAVPGYVNLTQFADDIYRNKSWNTHTHTNVERANGSDRPRNFTPAGSGWLTVWVDGNNNFCRNTSSIRFKQNVRDYTFKKPDGVLNLNPVMYDRRPTQTEDGTWITGQQNEVGLIAEEVFKHVPELVTFMDDQIDSVRYDLLGLALLPVVQAQEKRIAALEAKLAELTAA